MSSEYVKTKLNTVLEINKIVSLHYFEYVKDFRGIYERHDFWEIVYVDFGEIEAIADGKRSILHHGQMIFHCPWEEHNVFTYDKFASVIIISFECLDPAMESFVHKIFNLSNAERDLMANILRVGKYAFTEPFDIMEQIELIKKTDSAFGAEQLIKIQIEQLLISLIRSATSANHIGEQTTIARLFNEKHIVDSVINLLVDNVYGEISLDKICERIAFSKSYIGLIFKRSTGCGIIQYYNLIKVNESKRLLSEGISNFTEIADTLHFNSIHYFSRIFKQYTHMTPTGYQKSVKVRALL